MKGLYQWTKKNRVVLIIFVIMTVLAALRVLAAHFRSPVYLVNGILDERLMFRYSDFSVYFAQENQNSLLKYMSFPWLLNVPSWTGLSFNSIYGLSWVLAALAIWLPVKRCAGKYWALLAYIFVLFAPQGFDLRTCVHLYRNIIIAQSFYILFGLMADLLLIAWEKNTKKNSITFILLQITLALVFPFVYFIKEDSFWMMPVLYLLMAGLIAGIIVNLIKVKKTPKKIIISVGLLLMCFLPYCSYRIAGQTYKQANQKYFNYAEYTLRTNGELADFINKVYSIESNNRSIKVWAPYDALEKAFDASETLTNHPGLKDAVFHSPWTKEGAEEIKGDFLSWVMVTALTKDENLKTAANINAFMKDVNLELEDAFEKGILKKDDRIQLTKSAGGRTWEEVGELFEPLIAFFAQSLTFNDFSSAPVYPVKFTPDLENYEMKLGQPLTYPTDEKGVEEMERKASIGAKIAKIDYKIYHYITPVLFVVGVISWFVVLILTTCKKIKTDPKLAIQMTLVFVLCGISVGYVIGIVWFSQFLFVNREFARMIDILLYYGSGGSALFYMAILMAVPLVEKIYSKKTIEKV